MKSFRQFILLSIQELEIIKLGGNAVSNVLKIAKANIQPTLDELNKTLFEKYPNLKMGDTIFLLGSTGKKDFSGDIDIGIDFEAIKESDELTVFDLVKELYTFLKNANICNEIVVNTFTYDMVHLAFPQYNLLGLKLDRNCQIDILITPNKKFCQFFMYSPSQELSKYKAAHRNELFRAILKATTYKPIKTMLKDGLKVVVTWFQDSISSKGVYKTKKTLVDLNGKWLKYKNTDEDLIEEYAKVLREELVSGDPDLVIHMLVGDYKFLQIDTFLKFFDVIKNDLNFKYADIKDLILKDAAQATMENTHLVMPEELNDYI